MKITATLLIFLMLTAACGGHNAGDKTSDKRVPKEATGVDLWKADSIAYRVWGSPGSPRYDEARYIDFLDTLLAVDTLPDALRVRAERRRRIAMLNRPGMIAADFRYVDRNGKEARLHDLRSPRMLLIFYDPECPHCGDILRSLATSRTINSAIAEKSLTVIAVYAEGKRDVWDKSRDDLPDNWLVGYDLTGILEEELYDLPAMPTPYLLDSDKRVILKDPTPNQLIRSLQ